jgi:hypothetical protein
MHVRSILLFFAQTCFSTTLRKIAAPLLYMKICGPTSPTREKAIVVHIHLRLPAQPWSRERRFLPSGTMEGSAERSCNQEDGKDDGQEEYQDEREERFQQDAQDMDQDAQEQTHHAQAAEQHCSDDQNNEQESQYSRMVLPFLPLWTRPPGYFRVCCAFVFWAVVAR